MQLSGPVQKQRETDDSPSDIIDTDQLPSIIVPNGLTAHAKEDMLRTGRDINCVSALLGPPAFLLYCPCVAARHQRHPQHLKNHGG